MRQAVLTAVANVVLLGAIYSRRRTASISMTVGDSGGSCVSSKRSSSLLARALPLLALLVTFLFLTQEVWQTAGASTGVPYWLVVGLFPLVGVLFLVSRDSRATSAS